MPQQVAPLKIKSSQKNACVKSLEMYAITPVTYHVTFIFFISHVSNDIKTELAIRLPPCLVVWRIPLASISRGYK